MRQPLVAGNWKLNGSLDSISELVSGIRGKLAAVKNAELAVCPPYIYLSHVQKLLDGVDVALGAQDCSDQESGAYTGEVSAAMVKEFGCKYNIIGHSERRHIYGDSNDQVATKFAHVVKNGLIPEERESGHTEVVVSQQMNSVLDLFGVEAFKNAVIAYEPVWAIGTGQVAIPSQAQEVHEHIRLTLDAKNKDIAANIRILYGGSMKPDNAKELLQQTDIDGGLIGGAALKAEDFVGIALAAN